MESKKYTTCEAQGPLAILRPEIAVIVNCPPKRTLTLQVPVKVRGILLKRNELRWDTENDPLSSSLQPGGHSRRSERHDRELDSVNRCNVKPESAHDLHVPCPVKQLLGYLCESPQKNHTQVDVEADGVDSCNIKPEYAPDLHVPCSKKQLPGYLCEPPPRSQGKLDGQGYSVDICIIRPEYAPDLHVPCSKKQLPGYLCEPPPRSQSKLNGQGDSVDSSNIRPEYPPDLHVPCSKMQPPFYLCEPLPRSQTSVADLPQSLSGLSNTSNGSRPHTDDEDAAYTSHWVPGSSDSPSSHTGRQYLFIGTELPDTELSITPPASPSPSGSLDDQLDAILNECSAYIESELKRK